MGNNLKNQHYKNMGIMLQMDTLTFEAESVAFCVCQYFGLDTSEYSFGYIGSWSSGRDMKELRESMDTIRKTAGELIEEISEQLKELQLDQAVKIEQDDIILKISSAMGSEYSYNVVRNMGKEDLLKSLRTYEHEELDQEIDVESFLEGLGAELVPVTSSAGLNEEHPVTFFDVEYDYDTGITDAMELPKEMYEEMRKARAEYTNAPGEHEENERLESGEGLLLYGKDDRYGLYQLVGDDKGYRFMDKVTAESYGYQVDGKDYTLVYTDTLEDGVLLDMLYEKFNINHPEDYEGASMSMSDVVVMRRNGEVKAYYVDSIGYSEVPDFITQRQAVFDLEMKKDKALVKEDTRGLEVEQHDGTWHTVEMKEIQGELFFFMEHDIYGDAVSGVIVNADGHLVAQELEHGFERGAMEAIQEYFEKKGIAWEPEKENPFISRYYVVNDVYGIKAETEYQYFDDVEEALNVYHLLPNHLDKQIGMESTEQPPSRMSLIQCKNGIEILEDIEFNSLSGKWVSEEVMEAQQEAKNYLDDYDMAIAYRLTGERGYFFIQTASEGGYDYTFYDKNFVELDGGVYDNSDIPIQEAMEEILSDEMEIAPSVCEVIDCEAFFENVDRAEVFPQKSYEALKEIMDNDSEEIAFRMGYGYVSVQKVPEGYEYIVYDKDWQEIGGNSYDNPDASKAEVVQWIFKEEGIGDMDCSPFSYEEVEKATLQKAKELLSEEKPRATSEISRKEAALGGQSRHDIEETVLCYAQSQIEEMGLADEVKLLAARVYGSRTRQDLYSEKSDVDVVISYSGNIREDAFFNVLHEDGLQIAGLAIDINPISEERTGTMEAFMEKSERYLDEKEIERLAVDIDQFTEDFDHYEYADNVGNREAMVEEIKNDLLNGNTDYMKKWLQEAIEEEETGENVDIAQHLLERIGLAEEKAPLMKQEQPEPTLTFYVAECMEFPVLGEIHEDLTLDEAVEIYNKIPGERINGGKGIGFDLEDGSFYSGQYPLMCKGRIDMDLLNHIEHYKNSPLVQKAVADLQQAMPIELMSVEKEPKKDIKVEKTEKQPTKNEPAGKEKKESVLKALRERQAKIKAKEQDKEKDKSKSHQKGAQEL